MTLPNYKFRVSWSAPVIIYASAVQRVYNSLISQHLTVDIHHFLLWAAGAGWGGGPLSVSVSRGGSTGGGAWPGGGGKVVRSTGWPLSAAWSLGSICFMMRMYCTAWSLSPAFLAASAATLYWVCSWRMAVAGPEEEEVLWRGGGGAAPWEGCLGG